MMMMMTQSWLDGDCDDDDDDDDDNAEENYVDVMMIAATRITACSPSEQRSIATHCVSKQDMGGHSLIAWDAWAAWGPDEPSKLNRDDIGDHR